MTDFYLRLRRSGGRFWAYAKQWNTDAWTEVAAGATELLTGGPVEIWLSAYHDCSAFEAWFDWIIDNSEYADWPLPWCYGGSSSGSGHRLWGECSMPSCCLPMWRHPCTSDSVTIPQAVKAALLLIVNRLYDNRRGVRTEGAAGWSATYLDAYMSDWAMLLEGFRNVGV